MLNLAILDDDKGTIDEMITEISGLFERHNVEGDIIIATTDYNKFLKAIDENKVNCCIIDINLMEKTNGMSVAKQIRESNHEIKIIFYTACAHFIQIAYEVQAYWFVHKPQLDVLETALLRLNDEIKRQKQRVICIEVNTGDRENYGQYFIPLKSIYYIDCNNEKTYIHTVLDKVGQVEYATTETLKSLMSRIDDQIFQQCHKSIVVNTERILHKSNKSLTLHDGSVCDIGPRFRGYFKDWRPQL
ncbi:LytR/AlgR family response regulator transcription factor [Ruminiclostridium papyrosolvens]|uniref:Stage 0 sporulation protein A homolog n=1 Tax=Ruminiclostridium papyrosolvens C7 TaxID=1330534 RepID=U4R286_9FIRM|nr:LytTR family DNA-binding domain-containing protein [Ruminiclostridium papyrosolvens]EPR12345.1 hypothetical protein L323_08565 [Ruminiclostridium papyrosolvens C7]